MPYPPKIGIPRTEQFVTRVSKGEMAAMKRVMAKAGIDRSTYVRELIRADLKMQGERLE
jgi:predicted DNA binding CopG/RHH family protein